MRLAIDKEGHHVAHRINQSGIAGIVLKYRLPLTPDGPRQSQKIRHDLGRARQIAAVALEDGEQALRITRANTKKWGIKPDAIGIMGFSAGGHLASIWALLTDPAVRPNFAALIYPAISKGVVIPAAGAPPVFLVHADDDGLSPADNSLAYDLALKKAQTPTEMHVYTNCGHGFGLGVAAKTSVDWPARMLAWFCSTSSAVSPTPSRPASPTAGSY